VQEIERAVRAFVAAGERRSVQVDFLSGPLRGLSIGAGADDAFPGGSLLKLVLALAAYRLAAARELELSSEIDVAELARPADEATILAAFDPGRRLSLRELVRLALVTSDNAAADYLVRRIGFAELERELAFLGATRTRFERGFAPGQHAGLMTANPTCARDAALWLRTLWAGEAPGADEILAALTNNLRNTRLTAPFERPVPHKTGSLAGVVHDAALVSGREHVLALVVLTEREPDEALAALALARLASDVWTSLGERL
jgi:beta-lactamase class A